MTVLRKRSILNGLGLLFGYLRQEGGNIAAITALLLVPIIGAISMGVEVSSWFFTGRAAQNAADSAAVAAADNGASGEFLSEGQAAARQYGFISNGTTVTVSVVNGQPCPDATSNCYKATVTKVVPIFLTRIVGFRGDTAIGAQRAKTITSIALAESISKISFASCITAVGSDSTAVHGGSAIFGDGTPSADEKDCTISAVGASPSSIGCTGSNGLGSYYGFATGSIGGSGASSTCVTKPDSNNASFTFCNPYAAAATLPSGCTATSIASNVSSAVSSATASCTLSSGKLTAVSRSCTLTGNVTLGGPITGPSAGAVVVITNGSLNMAGYASAGVTYVFNGSSPGTLADANIKLTAPTSGLTSGIAAYQISSSACTSSRCDSWLQSGNHGVDVTGLLYLPYTDVTFGGSSGVSSSGNCFIMVVNSVWVHGTGYVLERSGCAAAGLGALPTAQILRAAVVG